MRNQIGQVFERLWADPKVDWFRFREIAEKCPAHEYTGKVLFRGESDDSWGSIRSYLTRQFPKDWSSQGQHHVRDAAELELGALLRFQESAHDYVSSPLLPTELVTHTPPWELDGKDLHQWWRNAVDLWAIMQHHGAATRLVDWSRSIYVAAYFAVSDTPEKDGRIWVCSKSQLDVYMQKKYNRGSFLNSLFPALRGPQNFDKRYRDMYENGDVFFLDMLRKSKRQAIQQGCFMMCKNPLADLKPLLEKADCLCRIVIRKDEKPRFLDHLQSMNITHHSLFSDLEGLAKSVGPWMSARSRFALQAQRPVEHTRVGPRPIRSDTRRRQRFWRPRRQGN